MTSRFLIILGFFLATPILSFGQVANSPKSFTMADTLRGMLRPERTAFDVRHYNIDLDFDIRKKSIRGSVIMTFDLLNEISEIQIDLFKNMQIDLIQDLSNNRELEFRRVYNAVFIKLPKESKVGSYRIKISYHGAPIIAKFPPWDGGFIWRNDTLNNPWIAVACEGIGASLWWPNKDHLSDEPDSVRFSMTIPDSLMGISNGIHLSTKKVGSDRLKYTWKTSYPINNYNVTFSIGKYSHFQEKFKSKLLPIPLDLDYYVLPYNLEKAKIHFAQVKDILRAFEHYFGPYPFPDDGYALIETPHLGMEHQGAIAYGNQYMRGYLGRLKPDRLNFDFIILHETAHEYFGNSLSVEDHAEMWIHESFGTYAEALYVEFMHDLATAEEYLVGQRGYIQNKKPIIGPLNVNYDDWGNSDHYFKGSWVLHTLRHEIGNDEIWFDLLKEFVKKFNIQPVVSADFFDLLKAKTGKDYTYFFDVYLKSKQIPVLHISKRKKRKKTVYKMRWKDVPKSFSLPIFIEDAEGVTRRVEVSTRRKKVVFKSKGLLKILRTKGLYDVLKI